MLQKDKNYHSKTINLLTDVFLNSILHPYLHIILNLLQYLIVFAILLQNEIFNIKKTKFINHSLVSTLILFILVLQFIFVGMIGFLLMFQKNQKIENVFIMKHEGYITKKVKQIVALFLIIYRKILGFVILQFSFWIIGNSSQTVSLQWIATIGNLSLFIPTYMFSGMVFANKIVFLPNAVSFVYKVNLQTLIFVYLPLMIVLNSFGSNVAAFTNVLFIVIAIGTLYIRPLVLYRHNKIGLIGIGIILGLFTVWTNHKILEIKIQTGQDYLLIILSSLVIACIIVKFCQKRINFILLCKVQNTLWSKLNTWNKDEIIFYHIANYETQKNSVFLYLVQELQTLKQKKVTQKEGSQKCILDYQNLTTSNQSIILVQKIIQSLKSTSFNDPQFRKLLNQFIFIKYKSLYNPKMLLELNMGKKSLKQKIVHHENLAMILAQTLLFDQINLRKCYTFMKLHQTLLYKIDSLSLINKIQIHSLLQIVENNLKFKTTTQNQYNLKAQKYFIFEQRYEQLKNQIIKACQQKLHFWRQNLHSDPDCHKIHRHIQQNYTIYTKIQSLTSQIIKQFQHKGPIILYDLIASYTTKVLNINISSSLNPFYYLIKMHKQQLAYQKKQGALSQNSSLKKYSLLQNIGVCLVDLQTQEGKIIWANQYFWTEFYFHSTKDSSEQKNHQNNFIFDAMIPQLTFRHKTYFKLFTQSQKLNHQHNLSFVFQSETKIFQRVSAQIQVFPSLQNGFNVSVFLFKNQKQTDSQKFSVLLKEDMSIVGYTEEFLKEKSNLTQKQYKTMEIESESREFLCEELTTDDAFHNFLQEHRFNEKKKKNQIEVLVQDSEYKVKILKIFSLDDKVTSKVFKEEQSTMDENFFTGQQIQKCIYLLQFQKKIDKNWSDMNDQKSIFKSGTTYQQGLIGNFSDMRSHASQFTSINSNNIQKALKKLNQAQKYEIQLDETQKKEEKNQSIQKKYKKVMFKKGSRATVCWIVFTIIVVFLLTAAILVNLFIFQNRQELYQTKKLTIKYFNELITDICQLCIALRQYNYFAYVNGPLDPRIPLLIDQVKNQESQVGFKINYLSGYMNDKWMALELLKDGNFNFVLQEQYVVIANFMLSSMTYLSQVNPQQMRFSPFLAQYIGKPLTSAQVNFNQAILNGIFVVLTNLSSLRASFLSMMLENITQLQDQIYIYPCIFGFFILFLFMLVSISIQKKSEKVRKNVLSLLSLAPEKLVRQKIDILQQFKSNNCFILATHISASIQEQKSGLTEKSTSKIVSFPFKKLLKAAGKYSNNQSQFSDSNQKGSETQNDTKRDLVGMEQIQDLEAAQRQIQNQKKMTFSTNQQVLDEKTFRKPIIKLPQSRMQKFKFLFYLLVISPSLAYFLVMILSGFNIDSYMSLSFQMGSQIHNKKTNLQLAFLFTRETFYFQKFKVLKKMDWKEVVMNQVSDTLVHDRMLEKLIDENLKAENLNNLMRNISHGNLCDFIGKFNRSVYYEITFSKEECESVESGLLKQGLKAVENQFLQTAIEIINSVPDPATFTIPQRYKYLLMPELRTMKILLAYLEQIMDIMDNNLQIDLDNQILTYTQRTRLYTALSISALVIIFIALKYRWAIINRHKKQVISVLEIISLQSIKNHSKLNKKFNQMPLKFHN